MNRPLLRYLGGKFLIRKWVIEHFPEHVIYVEPFGGALSVLMEKKRSKIEVVCDIDDEVTNLYAVLRDKGMVDELKRVLYYTPYSEREFRNAYSPLPASPEGGGDGAIMVERARRILIRSWFGYGALKRNMTGFRQYHPGYTKNQCHEFLRWQKELDRFVERMRGVIFPMERNALKLFPFYDEERTLWYLDPPYVRVNDESLNGKRETLYKNDFTDVEHVALAERVKGLKGMVVLSGYHSELYRELYAGWKFFEKKTFTQGGPNKNRQVRVEVIFLNGAAYDGLMKRRGVGEQHNLVMENM